MGCTSSAATPELARLGDETKKFHERFMLKEKLSDGCYSSVSVCVDRQSKKRKYAVKAIKFGALPRYQQKNRMMARLGSHEHIVGNLGKYADQELTCYFLMDLCKTTLPEMLKAQPEHILDETLLSSVFRQMLTGLQYCHSKDVVHRDIRPESFLVGFDGTIKLTGFTEACSADNSLHGTAGKVPFMSPEMLYGQQYGKATDIWSFGVTAYSFLFGEHPFGLDLNAGEWDEKETAAIFAEGRIQPSYVPVGFPQRSPIARTCVKTLLHPIGSNRPGADESITLVSMLQLSHETLKQMQDVLRPELSCMYNKTLLGRQTAHDKYANIKEQTLEIILEH